MANYKEAWIELKKELIKLDLQGLGESKTAQGMRTKMIAYWNKMTPQQQREIALKYSDD